MKLSPELTIVPEFYVDSLVEAKANEVEGLLDHGGGHRGQGVGGRRVRTRNGRTFVSWTSSSAAWGVGPLRGI